MHTFFFSGSTFLVVLGVVILALVVSIMAMHWAKLIYEDCYSDMIVFCLLIVVSSLGIISILILLFLPLCNSDNFIHTPGITFFKIKLVFMYIFGLGYLFHCGLYAWKHTVENKCFGNNDLGLAYNILSICYTFCIFVFFALFYERKGGNTFCENCASLFIIVTNACIWLDAIFSESGKVFDDDIMNNTESTAVINLTNSSNRATEAIKMTDSFLSPALIEFSLISIDLLFTQTYGLSSGKHQQSDKTKYLKIEKKSWQVRLESFFQIVFSLIAFALFAFTLVVVLTNGESSDLPNYPDDFKFYVYYQLVMKCLMFILITVCVLVEFSRFTFHFNVSTFVLLVACFGNVVYHILYCFALDSSNNKPHTGPLIVSLVENSTGILLALLQSVFIIGTHMPKEYKKLSSETRCQKCTDWLHNNVVYYACCLLGILNLGLWISDSIGELRLPVFSITIYKAFSIKVWSVINKIVLPLTIFFRFHTAFDFFEYYWKHDTIIVKGQDNAQLSKTCQGGVIVV